MGGGVKCFLPVTRTSARNLVAAVSKVKWILLLITCCISQRSYAQEEEPASTTMQLEQQEHPLPENDETTQQREVFAQRKLNLNTADAASFESLGLLHTVQIEQLLLYRRVLGPLISIYELQAVPGFDIPLIRTLLPYVHAGNGLEPFYTWQDYLKKGKHTLLLQYKHPLQKAEGYQRNDSGSTYYRGNPDKIMLRYRYQFSRYASWGIVMEKDAGEELFSGKQQKGFDHYGVHLFLRNWGRIKAIALGDYTVNMGQGLIQWHGLAFGKSGMVMHAKREGEVLRPYASAGEFFFYRGVGITYNIHRYTITTFISGRKLDARIGEVPDSAGTLVSTGYHRTNAELALKGNISQYTAGAVIKWSGKKGHVAWNAIGHKFSKPLGKGDNAYQLYAAEGSGWMNLSVDHAFNWRNLHVFGETAMDRSGKMAMLQGAMITLAHGADLGLVYRNENAAYKTLYGNAFGENAVPGNESGLYTALTLKWNTKWTLSAYADVFRFPWLKYRVDNPSEGYDVLMSLTWRPDKTTELNAQYRYEDKPLSQKQQWRGQWSMKITERIIWKCKVQVTANSFLAHQQCQANYNRWRITAGYTWFDTIEGEGLYLSGQGFPGDHSLARFSGKGTSTQLALRYIVSKVCKIWCRGERSIQPGRKMMGSGKDIIAGNESSFIQLQLQWILN